MPIQPIYILAVKQKKPYKKIYTLYGFQAIDPKNHLPSDQSDSQRNRLFIQNG